MWEAVETSARKIGMRETGGREKKGRSEKKEIGKREEEIKKRKNCRGKESNRRVGDMG